MAPPVGMSLGKTATVLPLEVLTRASCSTSSIGVSEGGYVACLDKLMAFRWVFFLRLRFHGQDAERLAIDSIVHKRSVRGGRHAGPLQCDPRLRCEVWVEAVEGDPQVAAGLPIIHAQSMTGTIRGLGAQNRENLKQLSVVHAFFREDYAETLSLCHVSVGRPELGKIAGELAASLSQLHRLELLRPFYGGDMFDRTKDKFFDVIVMFRKPAFWRWFHLGHVLTRKVTALRT